MVPNIANIFIHLKGCVPVCVVFILQMYMGNLCCLFYFNGE